jgi:hypothetical protein
MSVPDMLNIGREAGKMKSEDIQRLAIDCMLFAAIATGVQTVAHTWRDVVREQRMAERSRSR